MCILAVRAGCGGLVINAVGSRMDNERYGWIRVEKRSLLHSSRTNIFVSSDAVESPVVFSNEKRASSSSSRAGSDVGLLVVGAGSSLRHSAVSEQELYLIPSAVLLLPSAI